MKILFFMIAVLGFMVISQNTTYAQKKSKEIETWEVAYERWDAEYCYDTFGNQITNCIDKMKLTFTNNSNSHITTIIVNIKIINNEGTTLYKKKHTCKVDLDPSETAACKQFKLSEKVNHSFNFSEYNTFSVKIEILSVK